MVSLINYEHFSSPSFAPPPGPSTAEQKQPTPSQHSEQDQPETSSGAAALSSEIDSQATGQSENDELRKRRLAKFESESNPATRPNAED